MMGKILNECGCGRKYDLTSWQNLHYCGVQKFPKIRDGGPPIKDLEMRNCPCGSTRCVPTEEIQSSL